MFEKGIFSEHGAHGHKRTVGYCREVAKDVFAAVGGLDKAEATVVPARRGANQKAAIAAAAATAAVARWAAAAAARAFVAPPGAAATFLISHNQG